jgi:hypothetical protein
MHPARAPGLAGMPADDGLPVGEDGAAAITRAAVLEPTVARKGRCDDRGATVSSKQRVFKATCLQSAAVCLQNKARVAS